MMNKENKKILIIWKGNLVGYSQKHSPLTLKQCLETAVDAAVSPTFPPWEEGFNYTSRSSKWKVYPSP